MRGLICCCRRMCVCCFGSGALWMGWREPCSTIPAEHICSPTSLPGLQGSLGTSSPTHKMIPDFSFPVLSFAVQPMPSTTSSAFLSLSLLQPFQCSPSVPSLVLSGSSPAASFLLVFHLCWPFPSLLLPHETCLLKNRK